jgi:hypothetical protein
MTWRALFPRPWEQVAHALGRGARCVLYLRSRSGVTDSLQLSEVASYPPHWGNNGDSDSDGDEDSSNSNSNSDDAPARVRVDVSSESEPESFAFSASELPERLVGGDYGMGLGGFGGAVGGSLSSRWVGGSRQAITLSGGGSVDDGEARAEECRSSRTLPRFRPSIFD